VESDSLRQQAYLVIRDRILAYEYKPSDLLSESKVATELGMSRTPVRAALESLETDGLVRRHTNTGFFVEHTTPRTIADVFAVRIALETYSVQQLGANDSNDRWEKFEAIFRLFARMKRAPHGDDWILIQEADRLFHREIVARTRNEIALEITDRVELRFARYRAMAWDKNERYRVGARDHLQIAQAIRSGEGLHASKLIEQHLLSGRDHLISIMAGPQHAVQVPPLSPGEGPVARWLNDASLPPSSAAQLFATGES
jgi:DNA-binding GntR family transcriptional regulator